MTTLSITVRGTTYAIPAIDAQLQGLGAARILEMSSVEKEEDRITDDVKYLEMVVNRSGDLDPEACANRCLTSWSGITPDPVAVEDVPLTPEAIQSMYSVEAQKAIDSTAVARGYTDGVACASYSTSTIPAWATEAASFVAWRDSVWVYALSLLAEVKAGQREAPSMSDFIAGIPAMTWPN